MTGKKAGHLWPSILETEKMSFIFKISSKAKRFQSQIIFRKELKSAGAFTSVNDRDLKQS